MLAPPNLGADYGRDFAAAFTGLARERPEVVFYPFLLDGVAGDEALNQPDRHPPQPARRRRDRAAHAAGGGAAPRQGEAR